MKTRRPNLFMDPSPRRSTAEKIATGAAHFAQKRGQRPDMVWVHPDDAGKCCPAVIAGCRVYITPEIVPGSFFFDVMLRAEVA